MGSKIQNKLFSEINQKMDFCSLGLFSQFQ
jgi:hypothetical protein